MKKIIASFLITCALMTYAYGATYQLSAYDTLKLEVINHPELKVEQTVTPDGKVSLPLLGVLSVSGYSIDELQTYLSDSYSAYLENPQVVLNLTPRPIYVVQYDLKKDTWEVKQAKSVDEAKAYTDLDPTLSIEHGNVYKVTMSQKPDWWEGNWYKVVTGIAVVAGVYTSLK